MVTKDEREQSDEEVPSRVNHLQLLNALSIRGNSKGLSHVQVEMNGNGPEAMLDTGAIHNFVDESMVQQLDLKVSICPSKIKAVNSEAKPISGISFGVRFKVGEWTRKVNFLIMKLNDFDVILDDEFFMTAKAALLPFIGVMLIFDEKQPCYVLTRHRARNSKTSKGKEPMVSTMQVEHRRNKGETTYLAAMIEVKQDKFVEVPDVVVGLLEEFVDVMPPELPKTLLPRRAVNHKIELVPGSKLLSKALYRMSLIELAEMRKQLTELLDAGCIQPSKALYGAPVLFQKKEDGSLCMCVDYRALNKLTMKNKYPIPLIQDLFDRLCKATHFTKLDLRSGYWQVRTAEGDEPKTTCVIRYGSYEFLVMSFGLTNAFATFCNLMNDVFYEFVDHIVVVYSYDIVIYTESLENHWNTLGRRCLN